MTQNIEDLYILAIVRRLDEMLGQGPSRSVRIALQDVKTYALDLFDGRAEPEQNEASPDRFEQGQ